MSACLGAVCSSPVPAGLPALPSFPPFAPQETPGPGELPRFASSAIANPAALPLMLALLRRAADQDQLWGLAAFRELLLQGAQNLAAAEGAGLNGLLIEWLAATTAQEPAAAALAGDGSRIDAPAAGTGNEADVRGGPPPPDALTQRLMLQQQLLALLRVSGSYSISGEHCPVPFSALCCEL